MPFWSVFIDFLFSPSSADHQAITRVCSRDLLTQVLYFFRTRMTKSFVQSSNLYLLWSRRDSKRFHNSGDKPMATFLIIALLLFALIFRLFQSSFKPAVSQPGACYVDVFFNDCCFILKNS